MVCLWWRVKRQSLRDTCALAGFRIAWIHRDVDEDRSAASAKRRVWEVSAEDVRIQDSREDREAFRVRSRRSFVHDELRTLARRFDFAREPLFYDRCSKSIKVFRREDANRFATSVWERRIFETRYPQTFAEPFDPGEVFLRRIFSTRCMKRWKGRTLFLGHINLLSCMCGLRTF